MQGRGCKNTGQVEIKSVSERRSVGPGLKFALENCSSLQACVSHYSFSSSPNSAVMSKLNSQDNFTSTLHSAPGALGSHNANIFQVMQFLFLLLNSSQVYIRSPKSFNSLKAEFIPNM